MDTIMGIWVLIGVAPLVVWVLWWWNDFRYALPAKLRCFRTGTKLPPGYMGLPFLGEMLTFFWYFNILARPDDYINRKRSKYGDGVGMYRTHLFGSPTIIACSPSINKFIIQSSESNFAVKWPTIEIIGSNSLVAVQGKSHTRLKSLVSRTVNQPNALRRIALMIQPRIITALQSWAHKGRVTAFKEVKKVTFENIGKFFVNIEPGPVLDTLVELFADMLKGIRSYPVDFPGTTYHFAIQCRSKAMTIFREELERRKKKANGDDGTNDLMDGLMNFKDDEGKQLSDMEVLDNIVGLVVGGYESTSLAIMWALYYLAKYPTVLRKLREEHIPLSESKVGEFVTSDDVSRLKYTNNVVEETLRLANVASTAFRSATKDVEYKGYKIPKGWKVICWLRYLHVDPENFENPMCFNPDRWNEPTKPGTYLVFGGGSRVCAGNMLARLQLAIFLHHLVVGYKWELVNPNAKMSYLPHPKPVDGVEISISKI